MTLQAHNPGGTHQAAASPSVIGGELYHPGSW